MKDYLFPIVVLFFSAYVTANPTGVSDTAQVLLEQKAIHLMNILSGKRYQVSLKPLPKHLQDRPCSEPLKAEILTKNQAGTQRIQIQCPGEKPWSIYMKGNIDLYVDVLVSRHALNKGDTPQPTSFSFREENISELRRGYINHYQLLNNKQMASRIKAGGVITPSMLTAEQIIQRGDRITITAKGSNAGHQGGFSISMPGEALGNGAINEQIRVKNLSSGKILKGKIISSSEILIQ